MVHVRWLLSSLNPHSHGCFNWGGAQKCPGKSERNNKQHPLSGTLTFQTAALVPQQQFIKLQCILGGTNYVSALQVWWETKRRVVGMSSLFPMPGCCSNSSLPNLVYISPIQSALKHCHTTHQAWILCQKWVYSHLTFSQFILPLDLGEETALEIDIQVVFIFSLH